MRLKPACVFRLMMMVFVLTTPRWALAAEGGVISIGGSVTEIVYELGQAHRLVAVDITSQFPTAATELPSVGYMRALSAEPVLAMSPSLILAVEDAGPARALNQLTEAGVEIRSIPDNPSIDGIVDKVRKVAAALSVEQAGEELRRRIQGDMKATLAVVRRAESKPRVIFMLSAGNGPPLVGGAQTSASSIIELAGGANAATGFTGYKPVSQEAMVAAAPDFILVTQRTMRRVGGGSGLLGLPGVAATPAGANRRIISMDGLLLLGFGPRTPKAVLELARKLHAELPR